MPQRTRMRQLRESLLYDGGMREPHWIIESLAKVETPFLDDIHGYFLRGFATFSIICIVLSVGYFTIGPGKYIFLEDKGHFCDTAHLDDSSLVWPPNLDGINFDYSLGQI